MWQVRARERLEPLMYEAIIYSHRNNWSWRIEDADGKTVEDSRGSFANPVDAVNAAVLRRDSWNLNHATVVSLLATPIARG
jgi:hypothetical protein